MEVPPAILERLAEFGQMHLVRWWKELFEPDQQSLLSQIAGIDLPLVSKLTHQARVQAAASGSVETAGRSWRAEPPQQLVRLPACPASQRQWQDARARGEELLSSGRVGAILVAGGQGTRLGFTQPKGMFRIGPVSRKSLFQMHCEQLLARSRRAGSAIPYFIMTSDATHAETVEFFERHQRFGLPADDVHFFRQGSLPAVSDRDGRILMSAKHALSASPDGHGGILRALRGSGLLDVMRERGIELLYYHQVDNPAASICDPAFVGRHHASGSELSTKVVAKESAGERMGVVVSIDGRTEIIEYSDLPADRAAATGPDGRLLLWAGSTAMHVFGRTFLERLTAGGRSLPFHVARKAVPCLDEDGRLTTPHTPNAFKFEQFIFDALPLAETTLVVEADRAREFLPVKNHTGKDSPETCRAGLLALHREWLRAAGAEVADGVQVEISPLAALEAEDVRGLVQVGAFCQRNAVIEGPSP